MALDQLKAFLTELQKNKELLIAIRFAATTNEIAEIASEFGYQFSGEELKALLKLSLLSVLLIFTLVRKVILKQSPTRSGIHYRYRMSSSNLFPASVKKFSCYYWFFEY